MAYAATRTVPGTSDTPTTSDDGGLVQYTSASAKTITLTNSSWVAGRAAFAARISGGGTATFVAGSGVTVNGDTSIASGQTVVCQYTAANTWEIVGTDVLPVASGGTGASTAAAARANLQVAGPVFDVTAYGAVGNGTTNDTAAIQAAIDAAEAAGGTVWLPAGNYSCGPLVADSRIDIFGEMTIITARSSGAMLTISANFSRVAGLRLEGASTATDGLLLDSCSRVAVRELWVNNVAGNGVRIGGASQTHANTLSSVKVLACTGIGFHAQAQGYDTQIVNLWIGSCGTGFRDDAGALSVSNLHVFASTGNGVQLRAKESRFSDVYIEQNGGHGFDIFGSGTGTDGNVIVGGVVRTNTNRGLNIDANRTTVVGLQVKNNGLDGIRVVKDDNTISGCQMWDDLDTAQSPTQTFRTGVRTQDRGVLIESTADRTQVTGCRARAADHVTAGITDNGTGSVLTGNITT